MFRHASRNAIELCQPMRRFRHGLFIASTDGEETNMTPRLESVVEHWTPKSLRIKAPLVRTFNERENRGCWPIRNQTRRPNLNCWFSFCSCAKIGAPKALAFQAMMARSAG